LPYTQLRRFQCKGEPGAFILRRRHASHRGADVGTA